MAGTCTPGIPHWLAPGWPTTRGGPPVGALRQPRSHRYDRRLSSRCAAIPHSPRFLLVIHPAHPNFHLLLVSRHDGPRRRTLRGLDARVWRCRRARATFQPAHSGSG